MVTIKEYYSTCGDMMYTDHSFAPKLISCASVLWPKATII